MERNVYICSMTSTVLSNSAAKSEKKPTMKRRMNEHDYTERCIYMITLAVEGREPVAHDIVLLMAYLLPQHLYCQLHH